ncbi:mitochondrial 37S ribosomal protein nam9 [Trapelia coarctata]|nr:mitochondrial 37S ribosomal protein nam9 [Trapelia coarctata]
MRNRFYGLKKVKVRQSWNKYNLYNLSRVKSPINQGQTFFQQKWKAKALTRAYHGETIREKQWQRMFRPGIRSVVPMNFEYLARYDGSEQALGRGSGVEARSGQKPLRIPRTPYMNMVYAPAERRLDTAIFRALFASSTRQARQFVVHGYVKVNGKKMIYPGYQLNPGDMFQVEPDRVLFATGAPKSTLERRQGRVSQRKAKERKAMDSSGEGLEKKAETPEALDQSEPEPETLQNPKETLKSLMTKAKAILATQDVPAKKKQELRAFKRLIKTTLSRSTQSTTLTDSLEAQLLQLTRSLNISLPSTTSSTSTSSPISASESPDTEASDGTTRKLPAALTAEDERMLREALTEARENPIDSKKPYATPWRPRDFMSAFAFVPRYLEVHHKISSAVYLRHPVARPSLAEVPTPFPAEVNGLAFNWYLRRR